MNSIRRAAIVWMTALLTLIGVVGFVISYETARGEAADFLDGQLRQIALNVDAGARAEPSLAPAGKHDPEDEFVISVWSAAGELLRDTGTANGLPRQSRQGFSTIHAGGEDWRIFVVGDRIGTVQIAQRISVRAEMAQAAGLQTGLPILAAIPLSWVVIGWSLHHVLGRLTTLAHEIGARGTDSTEPIPVAGVPTELLPIVESMNDLVARLQKALEQQKRFVSDAAHELRTPLAALQIQINNLQMAAPPAASMPMAKLAAGVRRAAQVVDQLLRIARLEGSIERPPSRLELASLVTECVADFVGIADAKGVDLGIGGRETVAITGWPDELKILFGNLIDNAVRYTPAGGRVDVSIRAATDGAAIVEILDTGCGIPDEHLPRLFDRFFRAAPVDIEGSGLGLSIVDAVARRHGLAVDIRNREGRTGLGVLVSSGATQLGKR